MGQQDDAQGNEEKKTCRIRVNNARGQRGHVVLSKYRKRKGETAKWQVSDEERRKQSAQVRVGESRERIPWYRGVMQSER